MAVSCTRPRFGGSKVRTGCVTCKARHVKCSEEKPHCARCINAGRQCGGYVKPEKRSRKIGDALVLVHYVPKVTAPAQDALNLGAKERRALEIFQHKALPEFAGLFCGDTWSKSLLVVIHHEEAIRHAAIALGSLFEHFENQEPYSLEGTPDFALEQYGRAIQHVVKLEVAASKQAVDVALMACLLFTCFENIQGHGQSALTHILSGLKVLAERKVRPPKKDGHYVALELFEEMFACLDTQVLKVSGSSGQQVEINLPLATSQPPFPKDFSSVQAAMAEMDVVINELLHFGLYADKVVEEGLAADDELSRIHHEHARMNARFENWCMAFDRMTATRLRSAPSKVAAERPAILCLRMFKSTTEITLKIDRSRGEMDFDRFLPEFKEIASCGAEFIDLSTAKKHNSRNQTECRTRSGSPGSTTSSSCQSTASSLFTDIPDTAAPWWDPSLPMSFVNPVFTFSRGIITPLFIVCARCRDPHTRYRALYLLKICNRKEGMWDSQLAARVAQRIIDIEHRAAVELAFQEFPYSIPEIVSASQIPGSVRIRDMEVFFSGLAAHPLIRYDETFPNPETLLQWPESSEAMHEEYLDIDDGEILSLDQLLVTLTPDSQSDFSATHDEQSYDEQKFSSFDHIGADLNKFYTRTMLFSSGLRIVSTFTDWPTLVDSGD